MKKFFSTLVFLLVVHSTYAQALNLDSLRSVVSHNGTDTNAVNAFVRLSIELTH